MSTLALLGGRKAVTAKLVSPVWPRYSPRALATVALLLGTGRGCTMGCGRFVKEAEQRFAEYHGVQYALALNSGTASLHCALAGCGVAPGDEVITTPYSWGATTTAILQQGAIPVFADVLPETGLLDPAQVEAKITPRTQAILVVHIYGQPADMFAFQILARKHGLKLIEDASQAHGAKIHRQLVGSLSDAAGFSCMGKKLLAATEMGMLLTEDRDAYDHALLLSQHNARLKQAPTAHGGGLQEAYKPYIDSLAYNYRIADPNCVLMLDQLPHLAEWNRARAWNRDQLAGLIADLDFVYFPRYAEGVEPGYYMATLRYDEERAGGVSRATFIKAMRAEGVYMTVYVPQPIPHWLRMQVDAGAMPGAPWLAHLRAAGISSTDDLPVCTALSAKYSLQMLFNSYTKHEPKLMQQCANAFHKVAEGLPALREWQHREEAVPA